MRGGFSAPRRPRSGFKESSQEDAVSLRAPRERSRKEKPVLGSSASSSSRSRNNKKKRSALSEVQFPGSDHDQEEDGYETMEQLSPSPSRGSPVFSDEDDEHPQVRRRRESSSSAPKLKLPYKVPESNIISAGLGSIPRKVRSAFVKRAHEGTSSAPPIPDATATALHCFSGAKPPSPSNCNGRIRSVSPSPSAAKSAKRMKPIGTKPRPAKFLKVSAAFSEQEVEVAEVLFGFARQITSAEENLNDLKAASSSSPSLPPNVSSPMRVSSPISGSPSRLAQPTEGPKKKRPRPTKIDEIGSPATPATALAYCQSMGMEIGSSDNADGVGGFTNEITNVLPPTTSATQNHTTSSSFGQRYGELTRETDTVSERISVKFEDSDVVTPLPEAKTTDVPVKVEGVSESERNQIEAEEIDRQTDVLPSENSIGKFESPVMSPSIVDAQTASLEKMDIDLMAPPEKEANISENDSTVVAADRATTELPAEGTMGVSSAFEGKSTSVDEVRDQEKREDSAEYKEREKSSCKRDLGEESVVEQHIKVENIEEESQVDSMRGNDNGSSKLLPQKQERVAKTDSRMQKQEKPDVPSLAVSASCAVSCSTNGAAGPSPISMAVAGWPGALSALGRYFGPAAATWPGTPSLPGIMPVEGNLMKGIQRWQMLKRSATHAYIAHFIDYQQQMARNPFWTAAYGNPTALYGGKPYNLNIPFAPATEPILGSSLQGSDPFLSARNSNIMGSSFNESNIATAALAAISGHNLKEKATSSYMDVLRKPQQEEVQPTSSVPIQPNLPSFGFPITESGASTSAIAVNTGNACPLVNGKNSGTGPPLHAGASTNLAGGTAANSSLASMASAQAQYLAMFQQTGFHFPLPPMHFGATNTGTHNHHEHPQVFNGSFYAAHLLHPPTHLQQQGQQSQSNTGSSSQKHQQQFNFSTQQQQTPSSSHQHHHFSSSQTSQAESGYTNGVDAASTPDRKLPLGQKNIYSQDSPINSNNNANPVSLLATNSTGHSQDFTLMTAFGGKNNVKQQQMQISMQSHGFDPSMEISLKGQQCNQSTKQAVGRVKGTAQSTPSNYGDHITGASNLSKSQEASISGQSHKQHDQHLPEWNVSSAMPTSAVPSHQAVVAGTIRNSSQQVRHQQVSSNLLANLAGGAIPQAVFTTSTKNYGQQQSRNQHSNSSPASMSKSKTTGIPTSKTVTGGKGTASLPQRSIAPTSGKRSSPNHMSPSLSGNKPLQQQQQTTQTATTIGPGQVTGPKNQQYYTQAHFNPQQSYSQQIHQQLLFQQKHYLQQPVQQSQLSSQPAQHTVVHQQHLQIPGLNYSQPSLSNRHPQQDQRQQILPASVTPSDQVPGSTLSSGLPSLSLGSTSSGRSPAKIMPAGLVKANNTGTTVLHEQYNSLNDMSSTQKQCDSPRPTLSPHLAQVASVLHKTPEQKSESDGLHQDEVNGVHFVDLNICAQARTNLSTSSVQTSSIQKTPGNLKVAQGGNNEESMSGQGGTNLSGVPSGHTYQDLGSSSSEQTPPLPFQQTPVSRASGPISSVINSPHEAVASLAHL